MGILACGPVGTRRATVGVWGFATTNRGNWTVAAKLLPDNPYDGHTLKETLAAVERITGVAVTDAYVD